MSTKEPPDSAYLKDAQNVVKRQWCLKLLKNVLPGNLRIVDAGQDLEVKGWTRLFAARDARNRGSFDNGQVTTDILEDGLTHLRLKFPQKPQFERDSSDEEGSIGLTKFGPKSKRPSTAPKPKPRQKQNAPKDTAGSNVPESKGELKRKGKSATAKRADEVVESTPSPAQIGTDVTDDEIEPPPVQKCAKRTATFK
ncbi:hypothetical protein M501DRAFT_1015478 [Patellaria atrata CBS 101060]|uniref:Uncharacterized protein n=1 Tax=Patellaria atrata CBS 101060 TaxID=1346257 RepID=A0A9P4SDL4_9PEZI|nr:hypothetical protein M501DRAFT_1015478 [Patellaria atrata CBS 101060]